MENPKGEKQVKIPDNFVLQLSNPETAAMLSYVKRGPMSEVEGLVSKIQGQVNMQIQAFNKIPANGQAVKKPQSSKSRS